MVLLIIASAETGVCVFEPSFFITAGSNRLVKATQLWCAVDVCYLGCTSTFLDSGGSKVLILSWQTCDNSPSRQLAMGRSLRTLRAKAQQILLPKAATGFINKKFCVLFFSFMGVISCTCFQGFFLPCFQDQFIPFLFHWNPFLAFPFLYRKAFTLKLSSWPDIFLFFSVSPNSYSVMSIYAIVFSTV